MANDFGGKINITNYSDVSKYKYEWQKAYKYGLILLIPHEPTLSFVNGLREKYDKESFEMVSAHVSLTLPLPRELYQEDVEEIEEKLKKISPFQVHYGPLINFLPLGNGVVFDIQEQKELEDLYKTIEKTKVFQNKGIRKFPFKAHMTIAEFISKEKTLELTKSLNESIHNKGSFLCNQVAYIVPDEDFHFTIRKVFKLGKKY